MTRFFAQFDNRHQSVTGVLRFLEFDHISNDQLRNVSARFALLAEGMLQTLPDDPELVIMLRKLREAKDCAVGLAAVSEERV